MLGGVMGVLLSIVMATRGFGMASSCSMASRAS